MTKSSALHTQLSALRDYSDHQVVQLVESAALADRPDRVQCHQTHGRFAPRAVAQQTRLPDTSFATRQACILQVLVVMQLAVGGAEEV